MYKLLEDSFSIVYDVYVINYKLLLFRTIT